MCRLPQNWPMDERGRQMQSDSDTPAMYAQGLLSDDALKAIGCVAVESALLEYLVESHIFCMCELDDHIGQTVVDMMFLDKKMDFLRDAVTPFFGDDTALKRQFADVFAEIKSAIADRNTVIHGLWVAETMELTKEPGILRIKTSGQRKALKFPRGSGKARVLLAGDVLAVARRFSECQNKLGRVLGKCTDSDALRQSRAERQSRLESRTSGPKKKEPK